MEWIDTHCHLDHRRFDDDRWEVLERSGVQLLINPAVSYESNYSMRSVLGDDPRIRYAVGIHPNCVLQEDVPNYEAWMASLGQLADNRTVAVGETGLDHYRVRSEQLRLLQKDVFIMQLRLALELELPLILHIRDAHEEALTILRSFGRQFQGVAHCFTGNADHAAGYLELGFALGLGGAVTKDIPGLQETVRRLPEDRILLETDAPYVTPKDCKGRNSPEYLPIICQKVAQIKGTTPETIAQRANENAKRIFRLT